MTALVFLEYAFLTSSIPIFHVSKSTSQNTGVALVRMTAFKHEDLEASDNKKDKFLENAAESNEDYFLVPRVVE